LRLHFLAGKEEVADAIWSEFREVWLSDFRIEVISEPQEERESLPGARGGGVRRMPWETTTEVRSEVGRRVGRYIFCL